jgi:hypothetical protein
MPHHNRKLFLTVVSTLAILLLCPALWADTTITLTGGYPYSPIGNDLAGPYTITLSTPGSPAQTFLAFCLDANKNFISGSTGVLTPFSALAGGQTATLNQHEEEAAFLASYDMSQDPGHTNVTVFEGPVSLAIWSTMQTLGGTGFTVSSTVNSGAYLDFINAQNAVTGNPGMYAPTSAFMSGFSIWTPTGWSATDTSASQRFIVFTPTPEPGTLAFMGTGVLLLVLGRIRRRRR